MFRCCIIASVCAVFASASSLAAQAQSKLWQDGPVPLVQEARRPKLEPQRALIPDRATQQPIAAIKPAAAPDAASSKTAATVPPRRCLKVPASQDSMFRDDALAQIRTSLAAVAMDAARQRGWPTALVKSNETSSCRELLVIPLLGPEYRCTVTATDCVR